MPSVRRFSSTARRGKSTFDRRSTDGAARAEPNSFETTDDKPSAMMLASMAEVRRRKTDRSMPSRDRGRR